MNSDLSGKYVWDLDLDQIELLYRQRHMNNYVYAGLQTYHRSAMPVDRLVRLKKDLVPAWAHDGAEKLVGLSPYLGRDDPRTIRVNYTYYAYELFSALDRMTLAELPQVLRLLAALAYIPIVAEKNDDLPLWMNPTVRKKDPETERVFDSIEEEIDLEAFIRQPLWTADQGIEDDEIQRVPSLMMYYFVPRAVQSILVMIENGVDSARAASAFRRIEKNMLRYERDRGIGDLPEFRDRGNVKHPSNVRYRNTLYLYGGNHFERMGRTQEAFDWYTRDIAFAGLSELFGFYLTALKTCERLLCALRVQPDAIIEGLPLADLLQRSALRALALAANHARRVREQIATTPGLDLAAIRFFTDPSHTRDLLYAGEASREPFLWALLHGRIVDGRPYDQIDYGEFLDF